MRGILVLLPRLIVSILVLLIATLSIIAGLLCMATSELVNLIH